jgi:putative acetyltransferase
MSVRIARETPNQPEVIRLIDELDAYQKPLYPAESHHGIDMNALTQPNVIFAVARGEDGAVIGCGAIVITDNYRELYGEPYGELKRMFVSPRARGGGIGKSILKFLEDAAVAQGCRLATLETGIYQPEALGLYARAGYARCEPFGDYAPDPMSVFMRKRLGA